MSVICYDKLCASQNLLVLGDAVALSFELTEVTLTTELTKLTELL